MHEIKIGIAINNLLVREGVCSLLKKQKGLTISYIAEDKESLLTQIKAKSDDLLIIDFYSFGFNKELALEVCKKRKRKPVMALTSFSVADDVIDLRENGLKGYLLHDCSAEEIFEAIDFLFKGEQFYCGKVIDAVVNKVLRPEEQHDPSPDCEGFNISERELEIVNYISNGYSTKLIADKLCISPLTVKTHRKNIMNKLGVNNIAGIVRFAMGEITQKNPS